MFCIGIVFVFFGMVLLLLFGDLLLVDFWFGLKNWFKFELRLVGLVFFCVVFGELNRVVEFVFIGIGLVFVGMFFYFWYCK